MNSSRLILIGASIALLSTTQLVLGQTPAQFLLPNKVVARALVADPLSDEPIESQWLKGGRQINFAWDFISNCYSEQFVMGMPTTTEGRDLKN